MSSNDLRAAIEKITALSPKLNEATDEAAGVVEKVEAFLAETGIGIPAEVVLKSEDIRMNTDAGRDEDVERCTSLSYERFNSEYRLVVKTHLVYPEVDDNGFRIYRTEDVSLTPWPSCSRARKLEALAKLPELLSTIAEKANDMVESAGDAATAVDEILEAFGK